MFMFMSKEDYLDLNSKYDLMNCGYFRYIM